MDTLELLSEEPISGSARGQLLSWPGWGALAPAFNDTATGVWADIADRLETLLTPDEHESAASQVDTSFFSSRLVIDSVYALLRQAGFTGGRILEPGCGSGRFMSAAPKDWTVEFTGVEIDPVSARIAKAANPTANIITAPMQDTTFLSSSFDAAVGNVPFSDSNVFDPAYGTARIHTYFLRRALDAVRPGGYVVMVTSRHTMDSANGLGDVLEDADAHLTAAVRLPAGTFGDAGTDVVADILAFRKNHPQTVNPGWDNDAENTQRAGESDPRLRVTDSVKPGTYTPTQYVNAYWAKHPSHIGGQHKLTTFFKSPVTVVSDNIPADVTRAVAAAGTTLVPMTDAPSDELAPLDVITDDEEGRKEGSFHIIDGALHVITGGQPAPVKENAELRALIALRDAAVTLVETEARPHATDAELAVPRATAHDLYQTYVQKFGPLNRGTLVEGKPDAESGDPTYTWRRPRLGGFRQDPDYVTVMALEEFDQETGAAAPAPILLRRVNHVQTRIEHVETAQEALAVSLGETGTVKLSRIAALLGLPGTTAALDALGDLVYLDHGVPVAAATYLSGNVRERLADARRQAATDPTYERNVTALEQVLPAPLGAQDVKVKLGVPWIPESDIEQFAKDELECHWPTIKYTAAAAIWEADGSMSSNALAKYGTARVHTMKILEHALNGTSPVVMDDVYRGDKKVRIRNNEETIAAEDKLRTMNDRFAVWVWEDGERAVRLLAEYNRRFNSHVIRPLDGSYLTFPGLNDAITPWAHQRNAVDLIVSTDRALVAHPVGAGKTKSMILAALTLRRFGLAKKPLITVPKHLLEQIVREAQQAYPTARFLIAGEDDLRGDNRRLFAARAATGDWDAIVMTHQAFTSLPVSPEAEARWVEQQKMELREAMDRDDQHSRGAKAVAKALRNLQARLQQLRYGVQDDTGVLFEHLGVDYIMVDEVHLFRRLATNTKSRDNGFGSGSSKRASDLLLKIETLAHRHPGKPVVAGFTGTPWVNSLAETWTWLRYFAPTLLDGAGVLPFDPWVATFVNYETSIEVAPDGSGFRMKRRPVGVKNLPELRTMIGQVADIMSAADLNLVVPTANIVQRVVAPSDGQAEYVRGLAERADDIHNGMKEQRVNARGISVEDNMLMVCNDGRKAAIDPHLVGLDEDSTKLAEAADCITAEYRKGLTRTFGTATAGVFQLVLLDWGTPHPGDQSVYGRLRSLLVRRGVPADQIRFVHDAASDKARDALFRACRDGSVAVLFGSTSKVGMGTNIQTRLAALHHIDAPWTPAEVIQREGRGIRPKNLNDQVNIYRYVTEGSFDAFIWSTITRKQQAFEALYDTSATVREVEDISEVALGYAEMKALAAGNPLLLEQASISSELRRLQVLRAVHLQNVNRERAYAKQETAIAAAAQADADRLRAALARLTDATPADQQSIGAAASRAHQRDTASAWKREPWRGLDLVVTDGGAYFAGAKKRIVVEVRASYRALHSLELPVKIRRQGAAAIAEAITAELTSWADALPATISRYEQAAIRAQEQAASATLRADSATFDQQVELDQTQQRLDKVNLSIAAAAAEDAEELEQRRAA